MTVCRRMVEWYMNWKVSARKGLWHNRSYSLAFASRDWTQHLKAQRK